ncbi:MAG: glycosyltransferase family 39 protein [Planctomycetota bacterium]|nr:glycosyltransferase family 39 protein [Planctomycetota bacterium]
MKSQGFRLSLLLIVLCGSGIQLASSTQLFDRDEPRFARAAVEMVRTGDFLVPRFDGQLRPDKPPLVYWLMMPWIGWLGATDLAVRIPSILATLITALATFHIGRNFAGSDVGWKAALVGAWMPLPLLLGSAATADATMMAGLTVSLAILVDRAIGGGRPAHLPILTLALAWAWLAKGPVAPLIFLLASTWASIGGNNHLDLGRKWWRTVAIASLLALVIFLGWGIPANDATDGQLAKIGIERHLIERTTSALESHGASGWLGWILGLPFYLPVILLGAAPLSALLFPIVVHRRQLFGGEGKGVLLAALILPVLLLMTVVATKLPHYILGAFPGIAVMVVVVCTRVEKGEVESRLLGGIAGTVGRCFSMLILLLLAIGLVVSMNHQGGSVWVMWMATAALLATSILVLKMRPGSYFWGWQGPGFVMVTTWISLLLIFVGLGEVQRRLQLAPQIVKAIAESDAPDAPLVVHGYNEPSLVFALDRDPVAGQKTLPSLHDQYPQGFSQWLQTGGPAWLLLSRRARERDGLDPHNSGCMKVWTNGSAGTLNYSTGEMISLELWYHAGS